MNLSQPSVRAALLLALGVGLYANTLANQWALDDDLVYHENPLVLQGLRGIPAILASDAYQPLYAQAGSAPQLSGGRYRPLSFVSFAIEKQLFGLNPALAHAVNVLLFGSTLIAMFFLLLRLLPQSPEIAFAATFLFAIHPLHTEVVANVKSRDEILSLLFMLLALSAALKGFDERSRGAAIAAPVYGFLACMSKEYGVTLLVSIPLMLALFRAASWRVALHSMLPIGAAIAVYVAIRASVVGFSMVESAELLNNPYLLATTQERWATQIFVLMKYLGLLLWPHPLAADYSYNQIPYRNFADVEVWVSVLVHVALVGATAILVRRRHWLGFALSFYLVHLLLVSNLLVDIGATLGERLVYHSSFGFALTVAYLAQRRFDRRTLAAIGALILALGSVQIVRRNADWKNDDTLFMRDVSAVPNAAMANGNAGRAHLMLADSAATPALRDDQLANALRYLRRATEIHPGYLDGHFWLGAVYDRLGRYDEMEAAWSAARELSPQHPLFATYDGILANRLAYEGGQALLSGDAARARPQLEKALRYQADQPVVWLYLGEACFALGDARCARDAWQRALEYDPELDQASERLQSVPAAPLPSDP